MNRPTTVIAPHTPGQPSRTAVGRVPDLLDTVWRKRRAPWQGSAVPRCPGCSSRWQSLAARWP
jgi:hypothetical protein